MKVLFVSHFYPPEATAGVEVYTHTIARVLASRGHEVRVLCATHWGEGPRYWNGVVTETYQGIPVERIALNWTLAPRPLDYLYDNPVVADYTRRLMSAWQPDLVHIVSCYTLSASVIDAARSLGIPIALHLHDYWFICPRHTLLRWDNTVCSGPVTAADCQRCLLGEAKAYQWPRRALPQAATVRLIQAASQVDAVTRLRGMRGMVGDLEARRAYLLNMLAQCDAVIAPSEFLKRKHEEAGVPPGHIQIVRHGSHVTFDGALAPALSAALRVGYMGTLSPIKGTHVLIEAFQALGQEQATLQIHGPLHESAYLSRLRALAAHNPRIEFRGRFERDEILGVLRGLDVLVVPSVWYENSPLVIREAFAAGVPVIVSRQGALTEMVQDGVDGLLFSPGDADDLARQMRRLLDDPELLPRLRQGVRPPKLLDAEIDELMAIYCRLTSAAQPASGAPSLLAARRPSVVS